MYYGQKCSEIDDPRVPPCRLGPCSLAPCRLQTFSGAGISGSFSLHPKCYFIILIHILLAYVFLFKIDRNNRSKSTPLSPRPLSVTFLFEIFSSNQHQTSALLK